MQASEGQDLPGKCRDWRALLGPGVVVVDVWATFPTAGWSMELRRSEEQSDDPHELILERVVTYPDGYQPPVIRGMDVHWEEQTDVEYKTVRIVPDDIELEVVDRRNAPPLNAE
jgi:hypothetical protein